MLEMCIFNLPWMCNNVISYKLPPLMTEHKNTIQVQRLHLYPLLTQSGIFIQNITNPVALPGFWARMGVHYARSWNQAEITEICVINWKTELTRYTQRRLWLERENVWCSLPVYHCSPEINVNRKLPNWCTCAYSRGPAHASVHLGWRCQCNQEVICIHQMAYKTR